MEDQTDSTCPLLAGQELTYRRPGKLTLRVVAGPCAGKAVVLSKDRIVVGRSRTTDLILDHSSVSAAHFEIRISTQGIEVRDLNSTNGIRVGQIRILHAIVSLGTIVSAGECDVQIVEVGDVNVAIQEENQLRHRPELKDMKGTITNPKIQRPGHVPCTRKLNRTNREIALFAGWT